MTALIFSFLGSTVLPDILRPLVIFAVVSAGLWVYGEYKESAGYKRAYDEQSIKAAEAMAEALLTSQNIIDGLKKSIEDEQKRTKEAIAGRDAALYAERGLLKRINALAENAKRDYPDLAEGSKAAGTAIDLLSHMLARSVGVSRQLAEYADAARNAGLTCESSYEAVEKSLSSKSLSRLGKGE